MNQTIDGVYKDGKITLDKLPDGVTESRVTVSFAAAPVQSDRGGLYFGVFAPKDGQYTSDEELERVKKSLNVDPDKWDR